MFSKADLTVWGMTLKVMRDEGGVRALYRGLIPTAMGVAPYVGEQRHARNDTLMLNLVVHARHQLCCL